MVDGRKSGIVKRIRCKTVKRRIGGGKGQRDCHKMNRYRGYQWKVLRKGDVTSWTEINEVWNRGHHKLRTTSRFLVRRCHNHIHSPTLVVYHFLLLPLPLCITVSFSHVSCLFISVAFFFSTSIGVSHTHHWYPLQTEAVTNPWIHWMNTVYLRAQPWLDIVCIIFMLMHRAQFLCRWDEWYRHTFFLFFLFFFFVYWLLHCLFSERKGRICVFSYKQCCLFTISAKTRHSSLSASNCGHWQIPVIYAFVSRKKKVPRSVLFCTKSLGVCAGAETHPLFEFVGNMFSSLCNPADKPTNSPTNLADVVKYLGKVAP